MNKYNDYYEFEIPDYALPYIVNGDDSGIETEDKENIDRFLSDDIFKKSGSWEFSDESGFTHWPEFGLSCNCVTGKYWYFNQEKYNDDRKCISEFLEDHKLKFEDEDQQEIYEFFLKTNSDIDITMFKNLHVNFERAYILDRFLNSDFNPFRGSQFNEILEKINDCRYTSEDIDNLYQNVEYTTKCKHENTTIEFNMLKNEFAIKKEFNCWEIEEGEF